MEMPEAEKVLAEAGDLIGAQRYTEALALLQPMVQAGHPEAIALLGFMYQLGLGVEWNGVKAVELLSEAAAKGSGVAAHNLGTLYVTGAPGIAPDAALSKRHYRMARDLGFQEAPDEFYQ